MKKYFIFIIIFLLITIPAIGYEEEYNEEEDPINQTMDFTKGINFLYYNKEQPKEFRRSKKEINNSINSIEKYLKSVSKDFYKIPEIRLKSKKSWDEITDETLAGVNSKINLLYNDIERHPYKTYLHREIARLFLKIKQYKYSIFHYLQYLRVYKTNFEALHNLGVCFIKLKKTYISLNIWKRAFKIYPFNLRLINAIAFCYCKIGKINQALFYIRYSLKMEKDNKGILNLLKYFNLPKPRLDYSLQWEKDVKNALEIQEKNIERKLKIKMAPKKFKKNKKKKSFYK